MNAAVTPPTGGGNEGRAMLQAPAGPLLELGATTATDTTGRLLLDGAGFELAAGEVLGIAGASGSGKSLLVRAAIGLTPEGVRSRSQRWRLRGQELRGVGERALSGIRGSRIAYVGQDAMGGLDPLRTVRRELGDVLRLHGHAVVESELIAAMREAGLSADILDRRSATLSGGQRQRVLLAAAFLARPEVLIADEATTALDTRAQRQVLDTLAQLRAAGTAIVLVSHDLAVVAELADRIMVMDRGRVVESGAAATLLSAPAQSQTRALLTAAAATAALNRPRDRHAGEDALIEARAVEAAHPGSERSAVSALSLRIGRGETLGLIGVSGSGKSTVARTLLGFVPIRSGDVLMDNQPWAPGPERMRRGRRRRVAAIAQDPIGGFDPRRGVHGLLAEAIGVPRRALAQPNTAAGLRAAQLLADVGLPASVLHEHPARLSGGQRQRVAIACALAQDPELLICDEAVTALDATVRESILALLARLQRERGLAMLFISHDVAVVRRIAHRIAVLEGGTVVEELPTAALGSAVHPATRALLAAQPQALGRNSTSTSKRDPSRHPDTEGHGTA